MNWFEPLLFVGTESELNGQEAPKLQTTKPNPWPAPCWHDSSSQKVLQAVASVQLPVADGRLGSKVWRLAFR